MPVNLTDDDMARIHENIHRGENCDCGAEWIDHEMVHDPICEYNKRMNEMED